MLIAKSTFTNLSYFDGKILILKIFLKRNIYFLSYMEKKHARIPGYRPAE